MLEISKAILILVIQLIIYYLFGTLVCDVMKKKQGMIFQTIIGFLVYQMLFQLIALPMVQLKQTLTILSYFWAGITTVVIVAAILRCHKTILTDLKGAVQEVKRHKGLACIAGLSVILLCFYVSTHGELNDDSLYYIGFVNTTLTTDSMYQYNAYTGHNVESLYLRRALVTFDINTAVSCRIFSIHPLIITRITRACLNVLLTSGASYLLGGVLFRKKPDARIYAGAFMCLVLWGNFLFDSTIYTGATFFLNRAYEGKAFTGNLLVLFLIYLCLSIIMERKKWDYVFIIITIWACISISSTAVMVDGLVCIVFLLPYWILNTKYMIRKAEKHE